MNYIFGTYGDDWLEGTSTDDVIYGGEGTNRIIARYGNNEIYGGSGDDEITTGDGNDTIYANEGKNIIDAGGGDNLIYSGSGDDKITTGFGNDTIYAGEGVNIINTGDGDDIIYSGSGNDFINAGRGHNQIWLGGGQDTLGLQMMGFSEIHDFNPYQDKIDLGGLDPRGVVLMGQGNNTMIALPHHSIMATLHNVDVQTVVAQSTDIFGAELTLFSS